MQRPSSLHTAGNSQSTTLAHAARHAPFLHAYGAQSANTPFARTVCSSWQTAVETHWPVDRSHAIPSMQSSSRRHERGHDADVPSQTKGAHAGRPRAPAGATVHVPGVALQRSQAPSHADAQQTASAQ
jgi:hypothetical protein